MITVDLETLGTLITVLIGFLALGTGMLASHRKLSKEMVVLGDAINQTHTECLVATEKVRTDLTERIDTTRTDLTATIDNRVMGAIEKTRDECLAATERHRSETRADIAQIRGEIAEVRRSVTSLADRLFDETPRTRAHSTG